MKSCFAVLVATFMLALSLPPAQAAETPAALAAYRGSVTYVDFWASWCTPCAESFPWLNRMHDKHAARGLKIVGVGLDEQPARGERFLRAHPARFSVLPDPAGELAEYYAVEGMPYSVILDAEGRILHRHVGFRAADTAEYEKAIEAALAGSGGRP